MNAYYCALIWIRVIFAPSDTRLETISCGILCSNEIPETLASCFELCRDLFITILAGYDMCYRVLQHNSAQQEERSELHDENDI